MKKLINWFKSLRPCYRVATIIVNQDNNGNPFPVHVLEQVEHGLSLLPGFTCYQTQGSWTMPTGEIIFEPSTYYYWDVQGRKKANEIREFAKSLRLLLDQNAIYFSVQRISRKSVQLFKAEGTRYLWNAYEE